MSTKRNDYKYSAVRHQKARSEQRAIAVMERQRIVAALRDMHNRGLQRAALGACIGANQNFCRGYEHAIDAYQDAWRIAALEIEAGNY